MTKRNEKIDSILNAATELIGAYGYYGTSLERIGEATGMSKQNLLYYIKNKQTLMSMLIEQRYDRPQELLDYQDRLNAMSQEERRAHPPLLPDYFRLNAAINESRPNYVRMFAMLSVESLNPAHPAHDYFSRREATTTAGDAGVEWLLPDGVDLISTIHACHCAMDGVQLRWLREPNSSLREMWSECEKTLFPSPLWDGYK
ncbi:TetR family transcriptional regulator [Bifidobacterium sp. LC6]|uniref:TetR family transcriptional regulator n=1 Tax=Bifidobacterium colobi TaxID=2809026 RepID=A0ABS5UW74_9BIFI|nr:TetR family transcriptional regulator [Bifidobacterium colobi]MBT1175362.1 TetR family transcriptional regulator [Bifidobacterium colobi]